MFIGFASRILDAVRQSELISLDEIGRAEIIAAVTEDTATLTQAANLLAFMVQGTVLIFFVALYVAYLSFIAFVLSVIIIGAASALYHSGNQDRIDGAREAANWERRFFARMSDVLDGFKEIRLNNPRSEELIAFVRDVSRQAANVKIYTQGESLRQLVISQSAMYLLLGVIVFIVPAFSSSVSGGSITKNAMAVLFVVGACYGVMQTVAMLAAADAAAQRMEQLGGNSVRPLSRRPAVPMPRDRALARSSCAMSFSTIPTSPPVPVFRSVRSILRSNPATSSS